MRIIKDDVNGDAILQLLAEHLAHMQATSPPESTHALDVSALRQPDITFWSAWEKDELLGCGALKELGAGAGEIKSMRTSSSHLRKGVAAAMLEHIIEQARSRGMQELLLETGSMAAFTAARKLYTRYGFVPCAPFGKYVEDPNSVFLRLAISEPSR